MMLGSGVGAWILPGPREVAGVSLNVRTLLYAGAAVSIGFQSIVFAVFTTQRIVIPSITAMTLGLQVVLSSFFLSVIGLRRRGSELE